jgi:outer membrane beta-barrel protein
MKTAKTVLAALLGLASAAGVFAATESQAEAQEIQLTGPLAGAPAVRKLRLYREGRFEVAPAVSFTLLDEYRRTIITGGRLQYNVADWIGFGVWGGYGAVSITTDLTDQIDNEAPRNSRTAANVANAKGGFKEQTAKMQWVAAPQVTFVPFRGKLSIFQKIFVDTDAYIHAGVAFIGLQERGDCGASGQTSCVDQKSFVLQSRTAIAPTFGLGLSFYMTDLLSLGVEYRALPFSWNRAGFDSRGGGSNTKFPDNKVDSEDQTFKFNQMITIAIGIHLPTHPKISD